MAETRTPARRDDVRRTSNTGDPESIGKWLGLLLGALAGAFTFLGIEGEEVGAILRNQRWEASAVAFLLMAALAMSIVSFFVAALRMRLLAAIAIILLILAVFPAMIFAIATGPKSSNWAHGSSLGVAIALLVGALLAGISLVRPRPLVETTDGGSLLRRWRERDCPAQLVVLLVGVLLLAAAVYSGLRLETRSQYRTTSPQVSAAYETSDRSTKVILAVAAERLRSTDDIGLRALQLPRQPGADVEQQCSAADTSELERLIALTNDPLGLCREQPCAVLSCEFIAGAQLRPDAFGKIDETFEFPIDPGSAEYVAIEATLCQRDDQDEEQRTPIEGPVRNVRATGLVGESAGRGCSGSMRITALNVRIPNQEDEP